MKINTGKIKTYVGFAVKSRKIRFGVDDILKLKNTSLILVSDSLAESGMKKLEGYANKNSVDLIKFWVIAIGSMPSPNSTLIE